MSAGPVTAPTRTTPDCPVAASATSRAALASSIWMRAALRAKSLANLGQAQTPSVTFMQGQPQKRLHLGQEARGGRLRDPDPRCRDAKRPGLAKFSQKPQLHWLDLAKLQGKGDG